MILSCFTLSLKGCLCFIWKINSISNSFVFYPWNWSVHSQRLILQNFFLYFFTVGNRSAVFKKPTKVRSIQPKSSKKVKFISECIACKAVKSIKLIWWMIRWNYHSAFLCYWQRRKLCARSLVKHAILKKKTPARMHMFYLNQIYGERMYMENWTKINATDRSWIKPFLWMDLICRNFPSGCNEFEKQSLWGEHICGQHRSKLWMIQELSQNQLWSQCSSSDLR